MDLAQLDLLETRLTALIDRLLEAEKKNRELAAELASAQGQLEDLRAERLTVLGKIDELVTRLDL
ncbi:MAG: hypothetical protein LBO66_06550 [Deltaproteobacteria bacterium]|jgi:F0F1-type ATP synthase membrane subunit b/b'|nr:hypothetical protein [Deltaproteobacteria bacterium]